MPRTAATAVPPIISSPRHRASAMATRNLTFIRSLPRAALPAIFGCWTYGVALGVTSPALARARRLDRPEFFPAAAIGLSSGP